MYTSVFCMNIFLSLSLGLICMRKYNLEPEILQLVKVYPIVYSRVIDEQCKMLP